MLSAATPLAEYALTALTGMLAGLTLLPLSHREAWWIRALDFPRLQLAVVALIMLLVELATLDVSQPTSWIVVGVTLACLGYQSWWILPYTRLHPVEVEQSRNSDRSRTISIMVSNVLAPNRDSGALLGLIRANDPDIVVTLETDDWWQHELDVLESDYMHTIKCPLDNLYGMHVYSKLPLTDAATQFLVQHDVPSMHAEAQLRSGARVRIHFVHPAPPSPTENDESAERDAELLLVAKRAAETDTAVIVTGDLNDVAWSATTRLFRKVSGLLDPRVGRGMYNTYHANHWFVRWPLDHLFHSRHFTIACIRRMPAIGSDHFPVFLELVHEEERGAEQEGLEKDASDDAWASDKMRKQGVADTYEH